MYASFPTRTTTTLATVHGGSGDPHAAAPPPPISSSSSYCNLTTCLYHTDLGFFALTWTRHRFGRTLRLDHGGPAHAQHSPPPPCAVSTVPFLRLQIKPFLFWTQRGCRKLTLLEGRDVRVYWDLTRAEFESGRPEPQSRFYVAIVVDGEMALFVGDMRRQAHSKIRTTKSGERRRRRRSSHSQTQILRKENVIANDKVYTTRARIRGRSREITVDCSSSEDQGLCLSIDGKRVLQIKRLRWKFRGNERIEVDDGENGGVSIQVSWDVYNWVFQKDAIEGHAVFMFRFENQETEIGEEEEEEERINPNILNEKSRNGGLMLSRRFWGFGIDGIEEKKEMEKKKKKKKQSGRSWSSSSLSSASSCGGNTSVMEWASMEENELLNHPSPGFSLLINAWKR